MSRRKTSENNPTPIDTFLQANSVFSLLLNQSSRGLILSSFGSKLKELCADERLEILSFLIARHFEGHLLPESEDMADINIQDPKDCFKILSRVYEKQRELAGFLTTYTEKFLAQIRKNLLDKLKGKYIVQTYNYKGDDNEQVCYGLLKDILITEISQDNNNPHKKGGYELKMIFETEQIKELEALLEDLKKEFGVSDIREINVDILHERLKIFIENKLLNQLGMINYPSLSRRPEEALKELSIFDEKPDIKMFLYE